MKLPPTMRYGGHVGAPRTVDIGNFHAYLRWAAADPSRIGILHSDRRRELAQVLGPKHQTWTGSRRFDIWRVEQGGMVLWILSAAGKGTGYELEIPKDAGRSFRITREQEKLLLLFLDDLVAKLRTAVASAPAARN